MKCRFTKILIPTSLIVLFCCGRATGAKPVQQGVPEERSYTVELTDDGGADSPFKASGYIVFHEELFQDTVRYHYEVDITFTNTTARDIRAYEVEVDPIAERGGGFSYIDRKDFFFLREDVFRPGSNRAWRWTESPVTVVDYHASKTKPIVASMRFTVRFVEFADGTTYGGGEWGASLPESRIATVAKIKELELAYKDGGEAGLRGALDAALAGAQNLSATKTSLEHFKISLDQDGPAALIAIMNGFLGTAEERGIR